MWDNITANAITIFDSYSINLESKRKQIWNLEIKNDISILSEHHGIEIVWI